MRREAVTGFPFLVTGAIMTNRICIIATGDRSATFSDWRQTIKNALTAPDVMGTESVLIHGDAAGIDTHAGRIAGMHGWSVIPVPAMWDDFHPRGKAGPIRNKAMLKMGLTLSDHGYDLRVYAFHDNLDGSKGTRNMVNQASEKSVLVWVFGTDGPLYGML